jgi:hypothetical protein
MQSLLSKCTLTGSGLRQSWTSLVRRRSERRWRHILISGNGARYSVELVSTLYLPGGSGSGDRNRSARPPPRFECFPGWVHLVVRSHRIHW